MSTAVLRLIIDGVFAAVTAAPQIEKVAKATKEFVNSLMRAKMITKDQARELRGYVDNACEEFKTGNLPPSWRVDPDPK